MKIYSFIIDRKNSALHIHPKVEYDYVELVYGPSTLKENNVFEITKGKKLFDAISFTYSVDWVFSEKVKNLFEINKVTVIEFYTIIIEGIEEKYFGYYITGRAGKVLNTDEMDCIPMFEPLKFNETEWDGSDVFLFSNSTGGFINEKVKVIFEKNKVTNLRIKER